jgi:hypothetical protein
MDKEKIFSATEKVFDSLYARGEFEYEITTGENKSWFARRENRTAYIIEINIPINLQKILPTSKEYDPNYRKALERAREGADIHTVKCGFPKDVNRDSRKLYKSSRQ